MYLKNILLTNFRNYSKVKIDFDKGFNFFIGGNAQGKSNLIEAIYLLLIFRSPRTVHYEDMIKWDSNYFHVKGETVKKDKNQIIEIVAEKGKGKRIRFNQKDHVPHYYFDTYFPVVIFTPEDFGIIKDSPSHRRDFLDSVIGQTDKKYFYFLKQYEKILFQKNHIFRNKLTHMLEMLDLWNKQLIEKGTELIIKRDKVIKRLNYLIKKNYPKFSILEDIEIVYNTFLPRETLIDREKIKEKWEELFLSHRDEEIKKGISLLGPHRDDILFLLNGRDVKDFASQGQIRTILLSLHLAEIDFIYEELQEFPIVLLDEFFSELDNIRIENILNVLPWGNIQVFVSEIDETKLKDRKGYWFQINQGAVSKMAEGRRYQ